MKLKVKATSETLEVAPGSYICGLHPNGNEVEFLAEDVEIIPNDWDAFRREAAKDILVGMVSHTGGNADIERTIELADALIAKLKQE